MRQEISNAIDGVNAEEACQFWPTFRSDLSRLRYNLPMLTLELHDRALVDKVIDLLQKRFDGDPERMMAELLRLYGERLSRLEYSGRLRWPQDGLDYQREVRGEW